MQKLSVESSEAWIETLIQLVEYLKMLVEKMFHEF